MKALEDSGDITGQIFNDFFLFISFDEDFII